MFNGPTMGTVGKPHGPKINAHGPRWPDPGRKESVTHPSSKLHPSLRRARPPAAGNHLMGPTCQCMVASRARATLKPLPNQFCPLGYKPFTPAPPRPRVTLHLRPSRLDLCFAPPSRLASPRLAPLGFAVPDAGEGGGVSGRRRLRALPFPRSCIPSSLSSLAMRRVDFIRMVGDQVESPVIVRV